MASYNFIPGDIAHIKFTGEQVGILIWHSGNDLYEVRRCVRSKTKGSRYVVESYYGFELDDETTFMQKRQAEYDALAKHMKASGVAVYDDRPKGPSSPPHSHDNKPN